MPTNNVKSFSKYINNTLSTLENALNKEIRDILIDVGDETVDKIRKYLQENWYDTYDPTSYIRTMSLMDAVRYRIEKNKVYVYFDRRYFSTRRVNDGNGWQPHRGFDGVEFIDGLIDWIEDGTGGGGTIKNPRKYDGGIGVLDYAEKEINQYINTKVDKKIKVILNRYLKKK